MQSRRDHFVVKSVECRLSDWRRLRRRGSIYTEQLYDSILSTEQLSGYLTWHTNFGPVSGRANIKGARVRCNIYDIVYSVELNLGFVCKDMCHFVSPVSISAAIRSVFVVC